MRLYYLSRRSGSSNWYVAFRDQISGMVGNKRSTGTSDRSLAESLAQTWLRDGFPDTPRPSSQSLADYLDAFWDYDRSPYVVESLAAGKRIHRRHANDMRNLVHRYILPYFNTKTLRDIDEAAVRKFLLYLKTERVLASATVNQVRNAVVVGLRFAKRDRLILRFDFDLVLRCGGSQAERGILEPDEVKRLFEAPWRDPRSRLANRIAAGTGMRMGEIRALRVSDICPDRIYIRHAWSQADGGLKSTKSGESREIPLLPQLRKEIDFYLATVLVQFSDDKFLFPGLCKDHPFDQRQIVKDFYSALGSIGITEKERKRRNVVFHSWRHYAAKHLANVAQKAIGMKILGHRTESIFNKYSSHSGLEDLENMKSALSILQTVSSFDTEKKRVTSNNIVLKET